MFFPQISLYSKYPLIRPHSWHTNAGPINELVWLWDIFTFDKKADIGLHVGGLYSGATWLLKHVVQVKLHDYWNMLYRWSNMITETCCTGGATWLLKHVVQVELHDYWNMLYLPHCLSSLVSQSIYLNHQFLPHTSVIVLWMSSLGNWHNSSKLS